MLHDSQTDLVFIPMAIRYHFPKLYKSLIEAFMIAHVKCWEIPYTASKTRLWVRDWMPITVDRKGDMAQFGYNPDYLRAPRYAKYKPDMIPILDDMKITPFRYDDTILDGGNVLTDKKGRVYMTDKIFLENPDIPRRLLLAYLKEKLNARSIKIVHWDKSDIYGHVDGMMAIADDGSLITDLSWEYLNFLRVGNKIFMAQLGKPTDEPALKRIQEAFPNCIVFPIQHAQCLTRLGGGLHCATWNTIEKGYQNAQYFIPSKRHPFNPFSEDAFSEERLRQVVEYGRGCQFQEEEWKVFNDAFREFWNTLWLNGEAFSFMDMAEAIQGKLQDWYSPYFQDMWELGLICCKLTCYLQHIPKAILPDNTEWDPRDIYIPAKVMLLHFKDTIANLTSFKIEYEHILKNVYDELAFTKQVEKEAAEAAERKDGTVYFLNYRNCDKRRICPYRYTLVASASWKKHVRVIIYDDAPMSDCSIVDYFEKAIAGINFYDNYREGDCKFSEYDTHEYSSNDQDFPF